MSLAPIAIFAYNRPEHLRRTLQRLSQCLEYPSSPVTIFCDGARSAEQADAVMATRAVARELGGPNARVIEPGTNRGLAASIISGVSDLCREYGRVIVLEDDLLVHEQFLHFMNGALSAWADAPEVMQVSGFMYRIPEFASRAEAFFLPLVETQGWATWGRAWSQFDPSCTGWEQITADQALRTRFDADDSYPFSDLLRWQMEGKLDTWGVRWYWSVFQRGGMTLFPPQSLVEQTGSDGSGTHGSLLWRRYEQRHGVVPVVAPLTWPVAPGVDAGALALVEGALRDLCGGPLRHVIGMWRRARFALKSPRTPRPAEEVA